jgi:hypothetical protein
MVILRSIEAIGSVILKQFILHRLELSRLVFVIFARFMCEIHLFFFNVSNSNFAKVEAPDFGAHFEGRVFVMAKESQRSYQRRQFKRMICSLSPEQTSAKYPFLTASVHDSVLFDSWYILDAVDVRTVALFKGPI